MTDRILLAHGDGGQLMADLIERVFASRLGRGEPAGDDAAHLAAAGRLAFTTDAFVVDPIFFPGGDIGRLAICGTVNDLATAGARPLAISATFIIEEGLPTADLERVVDSIRRAPPRKLLSESSPATQKWCRAAKRISSISPHPALARSPLASRSRARTRRPATL